MQIKMLAKVNIWSTLAAYGQNMSNVVRVICPEYDVLECAAPMIEEHQYLWGGRDGCKDR